MNDLKFCVDCVHYRLRWRNVNTCIRNDVELDAVSERQKHGYDICGEDATYFESIIKETDNE